MNNRPWTLTLTTILVVLNAVVWFGLGIIIAANAHPALSVPPVMKGIMAGMSVLLALVLIGLWILLVRGSRLGFYLILAFFLLTAALTILDQVGLADLVVLALNLVPAILIFVDRKWYLRSRIDIEEPVR
jgi:hypothetical protein